MLLEAVISNFDSKERRRRIMNRRRLIIPKIDYSDCGAMPIVEAQSRFPFFKFGPVFVFNVSHASVYEYARYSQFERVMAILPYRSEFDYDLVDDINFDTNGDIADRVIRERMLNAIAPFDDVIAHVDTAAEAHFLMSTLDLKLRLNGSLFVSTSMRCSETLYLITRHFEKVTLFKPLSGMLSATLYFVCTGYQGDKFFVRRLGSAVALYDRELYIEYTCVLSNTPAKPIETTPAMIELFATHPRETKSVSVYSRNVSEQQEEEILAEDAEESEDDEDDEMEAVDAFWEAPVVEEFRPRTPDGEAINWSGKESPAFECDEDSLNESVPPVLFPKCDVRVVECSRASDRAFVSLFAALSDLGFLYVSEASMYAKFKALKETLEVFPEQDDVFLRKRLADAQTIEYIANAYYVPICLHHDGICTLYGPDEGISLHIEMMAGNFRAIPNVEMLEHPLHTNQDTIGVCCLLSYNCTDKDLQTAPTVGDGNCCYYSIISNGIFNGSVDELKERLLSSKHLARFANLDELRVLLETPYAYGDIDVLMLCALEFDFEVCLHSHYLGRVQKRFGSGPRMHFSLRGHHFEPLIATEKKKKKSVTSSIKSLFEKKKKENSPDLEMAAPDFVPIVNVENDVVARGLHKLATAVRRFEFLTELPYTRFEVNVPPNAELIVYLQLKDNDALLPLDVVDTKHSTYVYVTASTYDELMVVCGLVFGTIFGFTNVPVSIALISIDKPSTDRFITYITESSRDAHRLTFVSDSESFCAQYTQKKDEIETFRVAFQEASGYYAAKARVGTQEHKDQYKRWISTGAFNNVKACRTLTEKACYNFGIGRIMVNGDDRKIHWIVKPKVCEDDYVACFTDEGFVDTNGVDPGTVALFSVMSAHPYAVPTMRNFLELSGSMQILKKTSFYFHQGIAGHGKTTTIVEMLRKQPGVRTLITVATTSGLNVIKERLEKHGPLSRNFRFATINQIQTRPKSYNGFEEVYVDEATMNLPGSIVFVAVASGASRIFMFGDLLQADFKIDTATPVTKDFSIFEVSKIATITYRLPSSIVAIVAPEYDNLHTRLGDRDAVIQTASGRVGSITLKKVSGAQEVPRDENTVYLGFSAQDVDALRKSMGKNAAVSTIKAYQGREADHIVVYRDSTSVHSEIYKSMKLIVSCLTRTRNTFAYYTRCDKDVLSNMIKKYNLKYVKEPKLLEHFDCHKNPLEKFGTYELSYERMIGKTLRHSNLTYVDIGSASSNIPFDKCTSAENIVRYARSERTKDMIVSSSILSKNSILTNDILRHAHKLFGEKFSLTILRKPSKEKLENATLEKIDAFMLHNGLIDVRNIVPVTDTDDDSFVPFRTKMPLYSTTHALLQSHIVEFFPKTYCINTEYDAMLFRAGGQEYHLDNATLNGLFPEPQPSKFAKLRPVLHSPCPKQRTNGFCEVLSAFAKRNCNPPALLGFTCEEETAENLFQSFTSTFLVDNWRDELKAMGDISVSRVGVQDWLQKQDAGTEDRLIGDVPIWIDNNDRYDLGIKKTVKMKLEDTDEYQHPQTIVYSPKHINAVMCALQFHLSKRTNALLRRKFKIFSNMSPQEFAEVLNKELPPGTLTIYDDVLELDMSKFDKSQLHFVLLFELKILKAFGVPQEYIDIWYYSHVKKFVKDQVNKNTFVLDPQRTSGDAMTFLFNTIFLMAVLSNVYDLHDVKYAMFSGDDSLIFGKTTINGSLDKFHRDFNLEAKIFDFSNSYYFCSKFLICDADGWFFIPDPFKMLLKCATPALSNYDHCEEFRISLCDLTQDYEYTSVHELMQVAIEDRYAYYSSASSLLMSIRSAIMDKQFFHSLFFVVPGDTLCIDPSRSKIDY